MSLALYWYDEYGQPNASGEPDDERDALIEKRIAQEATARREFDLGGVAYREYTFPDKSILRLGNNGFVGAETP